MESITLELNGQPRTLQVEPSTPLLWILRDQLSLTGTKYGCGIGQCGACTVLLDGEPVRSCLVPGSNTDGRSVLTIEGLSPTGNHAVQRAWLAEQVPQCGYCQSGQILTAVALLQAISSPSDDEMDSAMRGNLCRCGTYVRIRRAIHRAALELRGGA